MKAIRTQSLFTLVVRFAACMVLAVGLSASALASCGDSLSAMAAAAASVHNQSQPMQRDSESSRDNAVNPSIVGLWHIEFLVGDAVIQEAFQLWNVGGTEVHNPRVDPRGGSVCLGVWRELGRRTFKLTHRVWAYDTTGDSQGVLHLTQTVTLDHSGNTFHNGSFTIDLYDLSGNFVTQIATGTVTGERIPAE
jgi:hypothetical protein